MKKILLASIVAVFAAASTYAQGTLNTALVAGVTVTTNNGVSTGLTAGPAGTYLYALLVNTATASPTSGQAAPASNNPLSSGWSYTGVMLTNVGSGYLAGPATATATGFAFNTFTYGEIVGWSSDSGTYTTWASVSAALSNGSTGAGLQAGTFYGISGYFNGEPGGGSPSLGTPKLFATTSSGSGQTPIQIQGFQLGIVSAVPEPSTMALAALGGASLLLFRRRQSKK